MTEDLGLVSRVGESFHEGGWVIWPIVAVGLVGPLLSLVLLVVTAVSKKSALLFAALTLIGAAVPVALGELGQLRALHSASEAVATVPPDDQEIIMQAARGEAMQCVLWGVGASLVPTMLGFALLGVGLSRLPRFSTR